MKKDIIYFIKFFEMNLKNAFVLRQSFWVGVFGMVLNNITFFVIWYLFSNATGAVNGWTSFDIFGMLGISMLCFGLIHSFFYGVVKLPSLVHRGQFDTVLLSPRSILVRLSGLNFSITALGDLVIGLGVFLWYGIIKSFSLQEWLLFLVSILFGCIIFLSIRIIASLLSFYIQDGELVSSQIFELFLRPGLYPGSMFPNKMKLFFMIVIPSLLTSVTPIDFIKTKSLNIFLISFFVTLFWALFATILLKKSIKIYESGNFLR